MIMLESTENKAWNTTNSKAISGARGYRGLQANGEKTKTILFLFFIFF